MSGIVEEAEFRTMQHLAVRAVRFVPVDGRKRRLRGRGPLNHPLPIFSAVTYPHSGVRSSRSYSI